MLVLVIDDSPEMQTMLPKMLDYMGFKSVVAVDGEEGLTLFRSLDPDLVLSDINMPGIDGIQLFTQVKENGELDDVPWVMMSSSDRWGDVLEAGCRYFLTKPFTLGELEKVVDTLIRPFVAS